MAGSPAPRIMESLKSSSIKTFFEANRDRLLGLTLLLITLAVYGQTISHDFILYDDFGYIVENKNIQSGFTKASLVWAFSKFYMANWHPVTWLSHMLDYQLFGLNPAGYHLINVFLHAANTLLLFLFLREATGYSGRSFAVAALFSVHPLHVESVAWISERKDVLCAFFWLLAMLAYVRYAKSDRFRWYLGAIAFFILGLMSKPMIVTLPFLLILLDYWPLGRINFSNNCIRARENKYSTVTFKSVSVSVSIIEKIPFFVLSVSSSVITFIAQSKDLAVQSLAKLPLQLRILNAPVSYLHYLRKTIWPFDLGITYIHPGTSLTWQYSTLAAFILVVISMIVLLQFNRRPYMFVGWFWFIGTLIPVIGLIQVGMQGMADRYTYMPLIGIFICSSWFIAESLSRIRPVILLMVLGFFIPITLFQLFYWRNDLTLFNRALQINEKNYMAHYELFLADLKRGNVNASNFHYGRAAALNPSYVARMDNIMGYEYTKDGHLDDAIKSFKEAIRINPGYANAYNNLGVALAHKGQFTEAVAQFKKALELNPHYDQARDNMHNVLMNKRK